MGACNCVKSNTGSNEFKLENQRMTEIGKT